MIPVVYNNGNQILQAPGYVVFRNEMIHESRVIPLDGSPHVGPAIRLYMGDSRGHWEGNTLVVETTNFTDKDAIGSNGAGYPGDPGYHSDQMKIIERFTRIGREDDGVSGHHRRSEDVDQAVDHADRAGTERQLSNPGVCVPRRQLRDDRHSQRRARDRAGTIASAAEKF